jgi:alpha-1,2-mannosyltransferase
MTGPWRLRLAEPRTLLPVLLALAGIAANGLVAAANRGSWNTDFFQFYSAGKLAGSGHLYDWTAIAALERRESSKPIPFGRIPAFALAFKPLSALPPSLARLLWLCAGIGALAGFLALWPLSHRLWALAAICWSLPAAMCLAFGEDSVLYLFFAALGLRLLVGGRDFWAGLALSVCAAKPHLALLLPVVLLARLKWRALLGGLAGGAVLTAVSFALEGPGWVGRLLALARRPEFDPVPERMPNLRGLLTFVGGGFAAEAVLGLAVIVAVWLLARRLPLEVGMTLAVACGLMLGHHGYVYDAELLLPALLLAYEGPHPEWLRKWALILFTPLPYVFFMTDMELPAHLAVTGYTVALMAVLAYGLRRAGPRTAAVAPSLR